MNELIYIVLSIAALYGLYKLLEFVVLKLLFPDPTPIGKRDQQYQDKYRKLLKDRMPVSLTDADIDGIFTLPRKESNKLLIKIAVYRRYPNEWKPINKEVK